MTRLDYAALNSTIRYTMWSVFRVEPGRLPADRAEPAREAQHYLEALEGKGITVRGVYDLAGLEPLQAGYADLRRATALGRASAPVWSTVALHRPAEFNKSHVPAFLAGEEPKRYVCVYPFVRSYEWYLLPEAERRELLAEHGMQARAYPDVRANTVASFALSDYEWVLAFEADELPRIVDLMRALRASRARRHVRAEVPFFTGPRVPVAELVAALP